ncbi:MAG TPA: hypothetical protein PLB91_00545 [Spirochaetales bacterium]|nr:hypothetical protein [Spirochaetales bacterium]HRY54441.1 hypothetical protein [Spirochaetia bacterium]HRZ63744.1 hypothetical protein [Spirochaetia bacterium]
MGDDNEIRQLIRRESESFLAKALKEAEGTGHSYDFEREFAKTAKNRSFVVVAATLATIAALGAAALGVTRIIEGRAAAAPVDVAAFEALNLRDLLDTAKRNESEMEQARLELNRLDYDLRAGIESIDRDYQAAVQSIAARDYQAGEEARRLKEAAAAAAREKQALRSSYSPRIKAKQAQIDEIQGRMDQYDQRLTDQARRQQELLDNERRVFEVDKKRQAAFYEARIAELKAARAKDVAALQRQRDSLADSLTARYNPKFEDERSAALLAGWKEPEAPGPQLALPPYLAQAGLAEPGLGERLERSFQDYLYLSSKLRSVPYLNSVPPALSRMEAEARGAVALYSQALAAAGEGLRERDERIAELAARAEAAEKALASYGWAVGEYLRENREGGYLLDPRDPEDLSLALGPGLPAPEGSAGYVVRGDKAIARISFFTRGGETRARVTELVAGEALRPFDVILVEAQPGAAK